VTTAPDRPTVDGLEAKWDQVWQRDETYRFDRTKSRAEVYSIDTPPPTVSGELHLGTVFGYVQVDAIARFRRMRGRAVFYPIGWDDNGLPTERRVQNLYGVRCNPALDYDPDLKIEADPNRKGRAPQRDVSRPNFLELCHQQTELDEKVFEQVFRDVGLSVDWNLAYATIDDRCRRIAQRAFLQNVAKQDAYIAEAPTLWDVDFQTAVAQAEVEDRPVKSSYVRLLFQRPDGSTVEIDTTRPELLPGCVAVVVSPDDPRYADLIGTELTTPLFNVAVPVLAHRLADASKGTGMAMVCTFGDNTDVIWWRELRLPLRSIINRDGRLRRAVPEWLSSVAASFSSTEELWAEFAGNTAAQARDRIVELLTEASLVAGEPRPIEHDVKFYEKGDRPLEIVTSRQWYIRNGALDTELRNRLLRGAAELNWHPEFMQTRLEHWIAGLNTDWLVSRQRFFGVPLPLWYPIAADGVPIWSEPIVPEVERLPVDPQVDVPIGFDASQRGLPGGFTGDPDVMDTWATSSLSPQIVCGWTEDDDLFGRTFPMDLRPQGPEIIRTWTFSTMLRGILQHDCLPWANVSINGWILDPDRKKMSKSKGNVETPASLVADFGADGVRYWACRAGQGVDTAVDRGQMRVGRRLAVKLLNVSKFVLGLVSEDLQGGAVTEPVDLAMLRRLADVADRATASFDRYDYRQALDITEEFFWRFCDDYVELVKSRSYGSDDGARSAQAALAAALSVLQRLLAPVLPFVAEEVWAWWQEGSVHRAEWPTADSLTPRLAGLDESVTAAFDTAATILRHVRKAKTDAKKGMRWPVQLLRVQDSADVLAVLRRTLVDVQAAGTVAEVELVEAAEQSVTITLADEMPEQA